MNDAVNGAVDEVTGGDAFNGTDANNQNQSTSTNIGFSGINFDAGSLGAPPSFSFMGGGFSGCYGNCSTFVGITGTEEIYRPD